MKKIYTIKYITFSLVFIFVMLISVKDTFATTYAANCPYDYPGQIFSTVSISPEGPFSSQTNFTAYGQVTNNCVKSPIVKMGVQNNWGAEQQLIPTTRMYAGVTYPYYPAYVTFQTPSVAGNYTVQFVTAVEYATLMGAATFEYPSAYAACQGMSFVRGYYTDFDNYPISGQMIYDYTASNYLWTPLSYSPDGSTYQSRKAGQSDPTGRLVYLENCP